MDKSGLTTMPEGSNRCRCWPLSSNGGSSTLGSGGGVDKSGDEQFDEDDEDLFPEVVVDEKDDIRDPCGLERDEGTRRGSGLLFLTEGSPEGK